MMTTKKAEMGIGTLILFIAFILVAAVAASVLVSTTGSLQSKALVTGKATQAEVGTSMTAIGVYAEDARGDYKVNHFFETIKLSSGSDPIRFSDMLLSMNTNNASGTYTYINSYTRNVVNLGQSSIDNCNISNVSSVTTATSYYYSACSNIWPNITYVNATYRNASGTTCNNITTNAGVILHQSENQSFNITSNTTFGVTYSLKSDDYTEGYIFPGDVTKLCFRAPRGVIEGEGIKITIVPKVGSSLAVETDMPSLMKDKRVYVFP